MTFVRFSTDDAKGILKMYVGEGTFETEPLPTKGGVANCRVPDILEEAAKYLGISCHRHTAG